MKKTTTQILLERAKYTINGDLPSFLYEAKASIFDYAANALNQQSCHIGRQYIESNVDFEKLYADMQRTFKSQIVPRICELYANLELIGKSLRTAFPHLDFTQQFQSRLYNINSVETTLRQNVQNFVAIQRMADMYAADVCLLRKIGSTLKCIG